MNSNNKVLNLALGGGGVKGIAYMGVFEAAEERNYTWGNISGVSAGSLAGVFTAAGYKSAQLKEILGNFDITKIGNERLNSRIPVVSRYIDYYNGTYPYGSAWLEEFLEQRHYGSERSISDSLEIEPDILKMRGNLIENIVNFSKDGYFCDGDYLEEWVSGVLKRRGIRTFADLKSSKADSHGDHTYKMRMTAVDLSRWKVITLPDDISYYGIDPDSLEVAKAVRMSTSVPFAFKPVEIKKAGIGLSKTYHIVDGGVLDNFPIWLVDKGDNQHIVGFRLDAGQNKILSLSVPLSILRALISIVHSIGIPQYEYNPENIGNINVSKISSLNFELKESDKQYLYESGKRTADIFFDRFEHKNMNMKRYKYIYNLY